LPVPVFAYRVREMEVEQVHCIGSHNFFVARVIHDEILDEGQELFVIHGFYHAWRIRKQLTNKAFALAEDALVKQVMSQH
jgi:flavin reductase (DIM6/NTAB) family NADH-FMN oxidoreductase RutF